MDQSADKTTPTVSESAAHGIDLDNTITAAWLYYHHNLTQAEIAAQFGISRPAVANLLARAREEGVVTITLRPDLLNRLTIAEEIRKRFCISNAYIVPTPASSSAEDIRRTIGKATALLIENTMRPGEILATAWGATVLEVAESLSGKKIEGAILAQVTGSFSGDSINPIRLASLMGEKLGARVYHPAVPALASSVQIKEILLADPGINGCFEMARAASRALIGIGHVGRDSTIIASGLYDPFVVDKLRAQGAVGCLSGRFYDINGAPIRSDIDERIISLTIEELRKIDPVIAPAGGLSKVPAILGALRTGCIDILVTDEQTARKVLELDIASPIS